MCTRVCDMLMLIGVCCLVATASPTSHPIRTRTSPTNPQAKFQSLLISSRKLGIYDGSSTNIDDFPYVVSVTYLGQAHCAGIIITDSWVLVSGDCVNGYDPYYTIVVAGADEASSGSQEIGVWQTLTHPKYNSSTGDYNYALLQIDGTFTFDHSVKNVTLPSRRARTGETLTVVGYGDTSSNGELMMGEMKVLSKKKCESIYKRYSPISLSARMGCMYNKGNTTVCNDDFSDPFVKDGVVYYLVTGIASKNECSSEAYPVIVADVYPAVPWIKKWTGLA